MGHLDYDALLLESLRRVYGERVSMFLESIKAPGQRLYVRVNTLRVEPGELLDRLKDRGVEAYPDEELPEAIYFRIYGPFKVNVVEKVVVVSKEAAEAVALGADLYAPGVLKCYHNVRRGNEVTIVTRSGIPVGEGVVVSDCHEAIKRRKGLVVRTTNSLYKAIRVRELPEFNEGLVYPQSLPAMYVARQLDLKPGELIVDLCASPGGKTGHVIELSGGSVTVIAFDRSKGKVERMKEELSRLGHLPFVEAWVSDSRYAPEDFPWLRPDKVIVDPPCSALGVRPKIEDSKTYRDVLALKEYQLQFLRAAYKLVKPGGIVVYSTCTVTIEENEEVITQILEESKCLDVGEVRIDRATTGVYGPYKSSFARFHPHVHGTPGYFIAKLYKKRDCY
ncbi:MAG: PUA domain-containing protein [Sulfolobales archaeon]